MEVKKSVVLGTNIYNCNSDKSVDCWISYLWLVKFDIAFKLENSYCLKVRNLRYLHKEEEKRLRVDIIAKWIIWKKEILLRILI